MYGVNFNAAISPEALRQALIEGMASGQFSLSVAPAAADQMAGAMTNFPWHNGASTTQSSDAAAADVVSAGDSTSAADAHCCGECWRKVLAELLYAYRAAIPNRCDPGCYVLVLTQRRFHTAQRTDFVLCVFGTGYGLRHAATCQPQ